MHAVYILPPSVVYIYTIITHTPAIVCYMYAGPVPTEIRNEYFIVYTLEGNQMFDAAYVKAGDRFKLVFGSTMDGTPLMPLLIYIEGSEGSSETWVS